MRLIEQLRWWAAECDRTNFGCQARRLLLEAAEALEQSATIDAVPVVRCGQCKHWKTADDHCTHPAGLCATGKKARNNYCIFGEQKGG